MPETAVRWLDEVRRADTGVVGGKAANLGELLALGFPVPPGFVVTASACKAFFDTLDLSGLIAKLGAASASEAEAVRRSIAERVRAATIPRDLAAAIEGAHSALRARCGDDLVCAVRSSATAEDTGGASFAGQHGTYYYVGSDTLLAMVRSCWASLWSREAVSYRVTNGIDHAATHMAVVVQRMIPSQVSGVTFTVNPVSGERDEVVVESSWGMGAGIVDGRVTPDRYVLRRGDLAITERRIAQKRFRVSTTLREDAVGRVVQVPPEQRQAETLTDELVVAIARQALRAEERLGGPQDVEWAVAGGELHILQSRPVTVSGRREFCRNAGGGAYVVFKPLVENFTDPLTPLTANLFLQPPLTALFRVIGGRVYLDLDVVRRIVPLRLSDADISRLLYLSDEGVTPSPRLAPSKLPATLLFGLALAAASAVLYTRTAHLPPDFLEVFRRAADEADADESLGVRATWRSLLLGSSFGAMLLAPAGRHVMAINGSSARYFLWMAVLRALLRRWIPDLPPEALGLLASGSEGVLSAEAGRRIWLLAQEARRSEAVRSLLLAHAPEAALPLLRRTPEAAAFLARFDDFLGTFGHRALKEFELRAPRWEEEPAPVLGMIRNYLLVESDPADLEQRAARRRAEIVERIASALGRLPLESALGIRRRLVRWMTERVKYYVTMRENSRFHWIMAAHVTRRKILRLEARLTAAGRLRCRDDIFFLQLAELEALERGDLGWSDVEERIAERRREHVRLSKVTPPRTIGVALPASAAPARTHSQAASPSVGRPDAVADHAVLRGQTASPGRCEGAARVILDPSLDVELRPGEVLVAPYTDPAWTPLFLTAGAAVVEVGSFLSHAGTVAREYGLPCVVDVPDCTSRIRTGDRLLVDGDAGTVTALGRGGDGSPRGGGEASPGADA